MVNRNPEFLSSALFQAQRSLLIHASGSGCEAEHLSQFILRQALHAHNYATAGTFAASPRLNQMHRLLPAAQIEVTNGRNLPAPKSLAFRTALAAKTA